LLDREHYSEWLVSSLENTSEARLPMWMLVTQLYWKDLLKLRKYGRRLVAALISHHHLVSDPRHLMTRRQQTTYTATDIQPF
jgi:mediator of RNA polymerase II transcription subunit 12